VSALPQVAAAAATQPLDDVVLKDGSTLRLRAPMAADGPALVAFFERLSPRAAISASTALGK